MNQVFSWPSTSTLYMTWLETNTISIFTSNETLSWIEFQDMSESRVSYLMGLTPQDKKTCHFILIFSFVCGNFFRLFVLRVVKQEEWFRLPINFLIFLEEVFTITGFSCWILVSFAVMETEEPLVERIGPHFCQLSLFISAVGPFTVPWLGVAIAFMRLLYIRWPLMSVNIEKRAARFLSAAAVIAGILMTCFWMKSPKRSPDLNQVCQGYSQDLVMTLYHLKAPNQRPTAALLCVGLAEMGYVIQFATYFVIFKYLTDHDKEMVLMLPEATLKKRRRKNAIDLSGQAMFLVLTMILTIVMLSGVHWMSGKGLLWTLMCFKLWFGIMGLCHVVVSPHLRHEFKSAFHSFKSIHISSLLHIFDFKLSIGPALVLLSGPDRQHPR